MINYSIKWLEDFIRERPEDLDSCVLAGTNEEDHFTVETISHALLRRYVGDYVARMRMGLL